MEGRKSRRLGPLLRNAGEKFPKKDPAMGGGSPVERSARGFSWRSLAPYVFRPGKSGNPGGKSAKYFEVQQICRDASPEAARVMIELLESDDDRVRLMAAREITERAWGRPKEFDPATEKDDSKLRFDPRAYSAADLAIIEAGLRLQLAGRSAQAEPEVIPPGER
jgi:hypothetical protein